MTKRRIVALSGGVGGAKLVAGLAAVSDPDDLLVVVNTGDDFDHLGLRICPDLDSVTYALAGENDRDRGWGRRDESWAFLQALTALGGPDWFRLGDRDLALHVRRTMLLAAGHSLTEATAEIDRAFGIRHRVVPMSDDPVATLVESDEGTLAFQDYFVRRRCEPAVRGFRFDGAERARPAAALTDFLSAGDLRAIVICPSNPFVSVGPILAVPGLKAALAGCGAPIVAVSPIVGGRALKGPADKMMRELGHEPSNHTVAALYRGFVDGLVVDEADGAEPAAPGLATLAVPTVMRDAADAARLADEVLRFADRLVRDPGSRSTAAEVRP